MQRVVAAEAADDDALRAAFGAQRWTRQPSSALNKPLVEEAAKYERLMSQAAQADHEVSVRKQALLPQLERILAMNEAQLQQFALQASATQGQAVQALADELHAVLRRLDALLAERQRLVDDLQRAVDAEDLAPLLLEAQENLEAIQIERARSFDGAAQQLRALRATQAELLAAVEEGHSRFHAAKNSNDTVKLREKALQEVQDAVDGFDELMRLSQDGVQVCRLGPVPGFHLRWAAARRIARCCGGWARALRQSCVCTSRLARCMSHVACCMLRATCRPRAAHRV